MPYTPNNQNIFVAAFTGAMAGMAASNRFPADYTNYAGVADIAGAFAQAIDTLWGANPSSTVQDATIQQSSEACWQNRAPQPSAVQSDPNTYYSLASALILAANAGENYFIAQGINPNAGSVPPVSGISGATIVERPGGNRISARLTQSEIDPSIAIASWSRTAPLPLTSIWRRGDTIAGITAAATYNSSGPPVLASVADSFGNGAGGAGVWSSVAPFAAWSRTLNVSAAGVDASPDPFWTATLTATGDIVVNSSFTTYFASDIYWGTSALAAIAGTDVYNAGLQPGFSDYLVSAKPGKRVRQAGVGSGFPAYDFAFPGPPEYGYVLWPDQAQYTSGTILFTNNVTSFAVPMTLQVGGVSILRNGVTRTYQVWRTSVLQGTAFDLRVQ